MNEDDRLSSLLREWHAPEPSSAMDARVRAAYRGVHRPTRWRRFWSAQVSIPVPLLAVLLLIVAAIGFQLRFRSPTAQPVAAPATAVPPRSGYVTRIETAGFQPLRDGATRVIRARESKQ